jgi:hypothetical protein
VRLQPLGHLSRVAGTSLPQTGRYPWVVFPRENTFAIACALVRLAVCCWRAAHQSITVDEATTYNQFVSGPWLKLFGRFDANNHILSSLLIKLSVATGGLSPFTMRFPSLIAGFFLTLGVFWVLKQVQSPVIRWTVFTLLCLHPLLLDFSIAARGYSLSLALFVWALYFCFDRRYLPAGFLLGLSIGANLSMLFPVLAMLVVIALLERKLPLNLVVPAFFVSAVIGGPSLRHATPRSFYLGYPGLHDAVNSYVFSSLHAKPDQLGILGGAEEADRIGMFGLPLSGLLLAGASLRVRDRRQLIPLLTLVVTVLGLVLAHLVFGVNYPADRTCLYFVVLGAFAWAIAADSFSSRWVQALWLLPVLLLSIQFSTQLQTRYFQFWQWEADDQDIAAQIRLACAGKPDNSMIVSASWLHQPSLEFYRRCWHISALRPVTRYDPTPLTGFDFYVLSGGDLERVNLPPGGAKLFTSCSESHGCN